MIVPPQAVAAMRTELKNFPAFPLYEIGRVISGKREVTLI